ncbi:ATP-binding protein [Marinimicrobium agarilyticum]|uniref:ATP-binding protein n=1 Tax=Marinimicrobium agarilyticum TaxID=306546 RepID=UPI00040966A3|nr:ATP-binding protein [Marinimicrobium agarilyticum]
MSQRPLSLNARLLLASIVLLPLFLGLTGLVLDRAFEQSLTTALRQRLQSQVYLLFSVAELEGTGESAELSLPPALLEPEFEQINSGLYGYLMNAAGEIIWRSNSAQLYPAPPPTNAPFPRMGELLLDTVTLNTQPFWRGRYAVIWEDELGGEHRYQLMLLRDRAPYQAELASYRRQLWRWLGAAALVLVLTQSLILRWGLRPLDRLAGALQAMREHSTPKLEGRYPQELQPVVDNLNRVLERETFLRQRYRDSLSNLAHSLKTPLSVLRNMVHQEKPQSPVSETDRLLAEQVERMDQVVNYQLRRAVSEQQQGLGQQCLIRPAAERLCRTLEKVYRDKPPHFHLEVPEDAHFPGDEQDLLELLGNLLDNACKYSHGAIHLHAHQSPSALYLAVEDNGPGIPPAERPQVLQRGRRLDTLKPGQGIGLSVAADIATSYGGQLELDQAPSGGLIVRLTLPV